MSFDLVKERVVDAKAIAWDTCHKIYVLMDDEQVELMRGYEYDPLITKEQATPEEMFATLQEWYEDSCGLRFIQAVNTHPVDPNLGFESLIEQGWFENENEEVV
jgi:hypothetical protein